MKHDPLLRRRSRGLTLRGRGCTWLAGLLLWIPCVALLADDVPEEAFRRDNVLGTSMDLKLRGVARPQAEAGERAVLTEVERLRAILHVGDPKSEISRLCAADGLFSCSEDLFNVLTACERWRARTDGAFNVHVGEVVALWKEAANNGRLPDDRVLAEAVDNLRKPPWTLTNATRTVVPARQMNLRVAALAKGYIIDKALAACRAAVPEARGILLDIGGDLAAWSATGLPSEQAWLVDVADPAHSEENAPPMTTVSLVNQSVATSGSYARHFEIGGKRFSHIIDPRTGRPVNMAVAATVVAKDTASADALATALCVLEPARGVAIVNLIADAECLIVSASGQTYTSRQWSGLARSTGAAPDPGTAEETRPAAEADGAWPKDYAVAIRLGLGGASRRRYKRPYMAAWITDEAAKPVKTIAVWGKESEYQKELTNWYSLGKPFRSMARSVTRASRSAGQYTLVWDGTDGEGRPAGAGTYTVWIEIAREDGGHVTMSAPIPCLSSPASASIKGNGESAGASITYGPRGT